MHTPHAVVALLLGLGSVAVAAALTPADASQRVSVLDAVRAFAAGSDAEGVRTLRSAAGLPPESTSSARPRVAPATSSVDIRFHFEATTEIQGIQIEVTYPLAKGEIAGSADGAQCSSDGDGFFIVNDRDDGTMVLIQASAVPLGFPFDIRCRFEQAAGQTLAAADIGVTIVEVTENGAVGDPSHLSVGVSLAEVSPICDAGAVVFTSKPGGVIDPGWTGIYHRSDLPHDATLALPLDCNPATSSCTVAGDTLADTIVGPPLPLSSGGVPICVLNTFRETPTGSYDCGTGCSELHVPLLARVFLEPEVGMPCPPCVGDPTPNDGVKGGTCEGGTTPNGPCDVSGITDRFAAGGATSNDCLPTGSSVGELALDLDPVTTGTTSVTASIDCLSPAFPDEKCYCPNQVQQNSCNDGTCGETGVCESGPVDGICNAERFRFCRPGTGTEDCDDVFPGSGTCVEEPRPCFGSTIERTGTCGTDDAALAAIFCVPNTRAAAINTVMGLPGPAAITLPVHVASGTPPPPRAACSTIPRSGCHTIAGNKTSILQLEARGKSSELSWRWLGGEDTPGSAFGDPRVDTSYALCTYAPTLVLEAAAAEAGLPCNGKACWHATPKGGFVYRDPNGTFDGLTRIELTPGATGKARVIVKGVLVQPVLPLGAPPLVQLQAGNGECWETTFTASDVRRNDFRHFRAARP